ncbi:hypothetical protein [Pseudorhodobacter aquimaris]|uniref:hypothetical protein n=1 Tax=Pseudorhodobacter aquimaris TaxID=687412 RepID=UPI000A871FFE|nr:hypothetical protein [Pseudorhodobacter aquimaris]
MKNLSLINATDLRDFLKGNGWVVNTAALDDELYVLENPDYARRQLVFPVQQSAADFIDSTLSVVEKFAELTGETVQAIIPRITSVRNDGLRLRVHSRYDDTTLPLDFASNLVENVEKLIKSAACTVLKPRVMHPRLSHREALQMIGHSRFGQTEVGSFIINVSCPINALDAQGSLEIDENDAPFVRQVFNTMGQSIHKLVRSVEADTLDELVRDLKESPSPLISSNMCEALAAMHDDDLANSIDIGFSWSSLRPITSAVKLKPIRIQRDYFSRIEEVRKELRAVELQAPESYIGTVERLDGDMGEDGSRSGSVLLVLLLTDEDQSVRANVSLNPTQYSDAIRAHETNGAYVRVTGRLRSGQQPRSLTEITQFELIPGKR